MILVSGAIITYGIAQYRAKSVWFYRHFTCCYRWLFHCNNSIVDAAGTRVTQSAISYYGASTTANAVLLAFYMMWFHPTVIGRVCRDAPRTFLLGAMPHILPMLQFYGPVYRHL